MCEKSVEWSVVDLERAPPTGLDRIDQTTGGLDGAFNFSPTGGQNVDVYVIDTGVDVNHPDIKGRAEVFDVTGEGLQDLNGHGSHVSGTIAGTKFGIAKQARITGIKVFSKSGKGANSNILRALGQVSALQKQRNRPGVVNMSLGGPRGSAQSDSVISKAIQALTAQGVSIAVAAGNENADACGSSPAFVPEVITVGAVDPKNDKFASFSNFGKCVDIIAPGVQIESIAANTAGKSKFLSGTSMSTPHVAGVLAVLMSEGLSRADAEAKLLGTATNGVVKGNLKGSPNKLLF
ncbi:peptidase S8/S53 domain-containing protein, partial [Blastocladiella britannica]